MDETRPPGRGLRPIVERLDLVGLIEHARGAVPLPESGHRTDDAGRALGLAACLPDDPDALLVASACLDQLERSWSPVSGFVLRLGVDGRRTADPPSDDATARAMWGLALAATGDLPAPIGDAARRLLHVVGVVASPYPRAAAHLILAGCVALASGDEGFGSALIEANRMAMPSPLVSSTSGWRWPEQRLSYGNGLLVEALLALGWVDQDSRAIEAALELLVWLVDHERTDDGHFSFTAAGGCGPGVRRLFDQQPIEAWALASACDLAARLTGELVWAELCDSLVDWFEGRNDLGELMWNPDTGAAYDGLTSSGPDRNEGTESTLALIGTVRARADAFRSVRRGPR